MAKSYMKMYEAMQNSVNTFAGNITETTVNLPGTSTSSSTETVLMATVPLSALSDMFETTYTELANILKELGNSLEINYNEMKRFSYINSKY